MHHQRMIGPPGHGQYYHRMLPPDLIAQQIHAVSRQIKYNLLYVFLKGSSNGPLWPAWAPLASRPTGIRTPMLLYSARSDVSAAAATGCVEYAGDEQGRDDGHGHCWGVTCGF